MTQDEELSILRDLIWDHCQNCSGCMWYEIPKTGLLVDREWRPDPDEPDHDIKYEENASCPYAQYWYKKAVDCLWRSAPCTGCQGCVPPFFCEKYQKWAEGLTDVQLSMCVQHWMENK